MKRLLYILLSVLPFTALADTENGLWQSVEVSHDFGKRWSVGAEVDFRTADLLKHVSRTSIGADASYKPLRWLKLSAGYTLIADHTPLTLKATYGNNSGNFKGYNLDAPYWRQKHRAFFDVSGKWKAGRLSIAIRERYQFTQFTPGHTERTRYRGPVSAGGGTDVSSLIPMGDYYFWPEAIETVLTHKDSRSSHILRSRLSLEYNIRHCPVTPCASYEIQNDLADGMAALKHRATAGIEWKVAKRFAITADYVYQHEFRPEEHEAGNIHALAIGAKIKL